jgi:prepilin-type N-terminal cleavage/methylation domain-containing protein
MISRQAFTLLELMVTVAAIGIVLSVVIPSTYTFLQQQKLRQASNELVSYLLTARARALQQAGEPGKACEIKLDASNNTIAPSANQPSNVCSDSPGLPSLSLLAASGGRDLTITSSQGGSPFYITFTRMGTVASTNLSDPTAITLPRIFYFSNTATEASLRRCVMVDLNSLRMGWRNTTSTTTQNSPCTYDGN